MSLLDRIARILGYYTSAELAACVKAAEDAASKAPDSLPSSISNSEKDQVPENILDHHYRYFVSYSYSCGFGCGDVGLENPIQTFHDIDYVIRGFEKRLKKQGYQEPKVVLLNWQLLRNPISAQASGIAHLSSNELLQRID